MHVSEHGSVCFNHIAAPGSNPKLNVFFKLVYELHYAKRTKINKKRSGLVHVLKVEKDVDDGTFTTNSLHNLFEKYKISLIDP